MKNFRLNTERLFISEFTLDDAPFILEIVNTPGWLEFIGDKKIHTLSDAENYLSTGPIKSYSEHGFGLFNVSDKNSDISVGICGLIKRDFLGFPDLGFALLPNYEGVGFAFEASKHVLDFAENELSIPSIYAITTPTNIKSQNLLIKLGFLRKENIKNDGESLSLFELNF
tara:strand:+ start:136735 stop:137244 length:510 start_codon:yes stop_codon:yes gene_type:complete